VEFGIWGGFGEDGLRPFVCVIDVLFFFVFHFSLNENSYRSVRPRKAIFGEQLVGRRQAGRVPSDHVFIFFMRFCCLCGRGVCLLFVIFSSRFVIPDSR
jgi:hypothetical protein